MTELHVGFLYNIASCFQHTNNENLKRLRSFYLMRCKEVTGGYGLPDKHFSRNTRCPHCCLEWNNKTEVKIKPIKLSQRQKQRIKSKANVNCNKANKKKALWKSNQLEQICSFCKHITVTTLLKPDKEYPKKEQTSNLIYKNETNKNKKDKTIIETKSDMNKTKINKMKIDLTKNKSNTNVYSNAFDVFSLKNQQNTLASTVRESPKIIKNNKRKKDKFAGLCQKAVLASATIKQNKEQDKKLDKLSLFLKPSSG